MRKLIALIAVLGFVPYAHAADGADFSHSGEFRLQYFNNMNADFNDDGATDDSTEQVYHQRLRWGTDVRVGEKMSSHFTLVHNADWGSSAATGQVPSTPATAANNNNVLIVNEAYMNWMVNDSIMLRAGRGSLTMGDGRFVSANEWEQVSKAFDGAMMIHEMEMMRLSAFAVRGADFTNAAGTTDLNKDASFIGVNAEFKSLPDAMKTANLHIVQVKQDETAAFGTDKETILRIGASVGGDVAGVDYRLNYEMEDGEIDSTGTKTDIATSMIDAEVGYSMPDVMNMRFYVGYHMDSGDKDSTDGDAERYDGFHYDKHNNAGLMDVVGWGNLTYMHAGVTLSPSDDMNVGLAYYMFTKTEKEDDIYRASGAAFGTGITNEDEIGSEIDVWVTKKYTNNFSIMARYGMFAGGDAIVANADDRSQIYLESKLTF